jgi:hypothetical protein
MDGLAVRVDYEPAPAEAGDDRSPVRSTGIRSFVTTLLAAAALLVTPGPSRAAEPIINIDRSDGAINFSVDVYDYCGDGVGECADLSITLSRDGRKNTETIADPRSRDGEFLFAYRILCAGSGELGWSITVSAVDGRAPLVRSRRVTPARQLT